MRESDYYYDTAHPQVIETQGQKRSDGFTQREGGRREGGQLII
jgi:hypothetical protein